MSNKVSIMQEMFKKEGSDELVPAVTIISVSYTHLDVYKRQLSGSWLDKLHQSATDVGAGLVSLTSNLSCP